MNVDYYISMIDFYLENIQTDDPRLSTFYASLAQEWLKLLSSELKKEETCTK